MTYLGLDLGTKTLGISKSNGIIASFYKTLRHEENYDYLIDELESIVKEEHIDKIILGYPKNMNNTESEMSKIVLEFKDKLDKKRKILWVVFDNKDFETKTGKVIHVRRSEIVNDDEYNEEDDDTLTF